MTLHLTDDLDALKGRLAQYERPFDEADVNEALKTSDAQRDHNLYAGQLRTIIGHCLQILAAALRRERAAKEAAERELARMKAVGLRLDADPHQWSKRPCSTCSEISADLGRDFGCVAYAKSPLKYSAYVQEARNALAALKKAQEGV